MSFNTLSFFAFFPLCAGAYFLVPKKYQNAVLLAASWLFYAFATPVWLPVLVLDSLATYAAVRWMARAAGSARRRRLWLAVGLNLGLLVGLKALGAALAGLPMAQGALQALEALGLSASAQRFSLVLPLGISFFTLQAIGCAVDVYRETCPVPQSAVHFCLFTSFFGFISSGPITRAGSFLPQLQTPRRFDADRAVSGLVLMAQGLLAKVCVADLLAILANGVWGNVRAYSGPVLAVGALAYTFQLYFDFSGYSDMAIGLARMFGFHLLENFNLPFIARSIAGFWKRWHISLTSWFRDYLYFPLGGSRVSKGRLLFNMGVVWVLTGFWHGAQWTYLVWGFLFFVLQAFERFSGAGKWLEKHRIGHLYVFLVVMIASVVSRADSIPHALDLYRSMFGLDGSAIFDDTARMFLREYGAFLVAGVLCCLPVPKRIPDAVRGVGLAAAGFVAITYVVMGSYNPFIYFNF